MTHFYSPLSICSQLTITGRSKVFHNWLNVELPVPVDTTIERSSIYFLECCPFLLHVFIWFVICCSTSSKSLISDWYFYWPFCLLLKISHFIFSNFQKFIEHCIFIGSVGLFSSSYSRLFSFPLKNIFSQSLISS